MRCGFAPHIIRHSRPNWAPSNQLFHCKILWWIRTTSLTYLLLAFTYSATHQIANHGFEPFLPYKSFHQPSCWPWYLTSRASTLLDMHNTPYWQRPSYVYEDCIGFCMSLLTINRQPQDRTADFAHVFCLENFVLSEYEGIVCICARAIPLHNCR